MGGAGVEPSFVSVLASDARPLPQPKRFGFADAGDSVKFVDASTAADNAGTAGTSGNNGTGSGASCELYSPWPKEEEVEELSDDEDNDGITADGIAADGIAADDIAADDIGADVLSFTSPLFESLDDKPNEDEKTETGGEAGCDDVESSEDEEE